MYYMSSPMTTPPSLGLGHHQLPWSLSLLPTLVGSDIPHYSTVVASLQYKLYP